MFQHNENEWVHKEHTMFNIFPFLLLLIKLNAYAVNSQIYTFESVYNQKEHFYAVCWHKQPPDNKPNNFDKSVKAILKAMTNTVF